MILTLKKFHNCTHNYKKNGGTYETKTDWSHLLAETVEIE